MGGVKVCGLPGGEEHVCEPRASVAAFQERKRCAKKFGRREDNRGEQADKKTGIRKRWGTDVKAFRCEIDL